MTDLWEDEGFGSAGATPDADGEDDWDEGDESLDSALDEGFEDPGVDESSTGEDA